MFLLIIYIWAVFNFGGLGGSSPNPSFGAFTNPVIYIIIIAITLISSVILTIFIKWGKEIVNKVKSNKNKF